MGVTTVDAVGAVGARCELGSGAIGVAARAAGGVEAVVRAYHARGMWGRGRRRGATVTVDAIVAACAHRGLGSGAAVVPIGVGGVEARLHADA